MTTADEVRPLGEIMRRAFGALDREIGPEDTARFLTAVRGTSGDYTAERVQIFAHLSPDELWAELEEFTKRLKAKSG